MDQTKPTKSTTWDKIAGQWKQFSGDLKKRWGNLTDDEMMEINGNREVLAGKIQEKYAITREEANKQIDEWSDNVKF